jgi:hypothetical protein
VPLEVVVRGRRVARHAHIADHVARGHGPQPAEGGEVGVVRVPPDSVDLDLHPTQITRGGNRGAVERSHDRRARGCGDVVALVHVSGRAGHLTDRPEVVCHRDASGDRAALEGERVDPRRELIALVPYRAHTSTRRPHELTFLPTKLSDPVELLLADLTESFVVACLADGRGVVESFLCHADPLVQDHSARPSGLLDLADPVAQISFLP